MAARNRRERPAPGRDAGAADLPCRTCTVTVTPKPLTICVISGHGATYDRSTASLTARGQPAGGSYSWRSTDTTKATVTGNGPSCTVTGLAKGTVNIEVTYTPPDCTPCVDRVPVKVCLCTRVNKYAYWIKAIANLNGAKAKIGTRWAKLCCEGEGCAIAHALHCTYVNISNTDGWAQSGYGRERNYGSTAISIDRYAEVNGDTYHIRKIPGPREGTSHEYKIQLNPDTGEWSFFFDGRNWHTHTDPFWNGRRGDSVQWTGEIHNTDDNMSGTSKGKCTFRKCQYRVRGPRVYQNAGIPAGGPSTDDAAEWGAERVGAMGLNIWDKRVR